jgi:hypothetical protein
VTSRINKVEVRLTDEELAELDAQRDGLPRAVYLRTLLHRPPEVADVASRHESLALLTALARDGRVSAAIALERALRGDGGAGSGENDLLSEFLDGGDG